MPLATGGLVNLPSKGVPIGGAITGESAVEGVLPLTNSQAMETIGEMIGKHITINNVIENKMNGRLINRAIKITQGQQDFAYNS